MQLLVRESLMALMRLNDEIVMTPEMNFSKREKEILKWTAEGKTSAEIAMILSDPLEYGQFPSEKHAEKNQCTK